MSEDPYEGVALHQSKDNSETSPFWNPSWFEVAEKKVKALEINRRGAIGACKHKTVEVLSWEVSSQFNVFSRELYKGNYQPCKYVE
jgi:hypothetical protein